ncbi:MAG: aminoglycoside phosphotransferase family protein, partial [Pedobacter sp.]
MGLIVSDKILAAYGILNDTIKITKIGSGHINRTFLISDSGSGEQHILQEVNTNVFPSPWNIARNIAIVDAYLKKNYPDYLFPAPVLTNEGMQMAAYDGKFWRLLPFIQNSVALDTLTDPSQAFEAAKQFGKLTRLINEVPANTLIPTILNFHNLNLRVQQFTESLEKSADQLRRDAMETINDVEKFGFITQQYNLLLASGALKDRIMHHDTKISNILLDDVSGKGICVIDLDTLMPGKFISDLGDMFRTYLCAYSEDEPDLNKIMIRLPYFEATVRGYLSEVKT